MKNIRKATIQDLERIAEIYVFNYRLYFYPIFKCDEFYFEEMTVSNEMDTFKNLIDSIYVYDDGVVKGFIHIDGKEVKKLFIEPVLQGSGIGTKLLNYKDVNGLWALEKNERAIAFYKRNGFTVTNIKKYEEGTNEYLVWLEK